MSGFDIHLLSSCCCLPGHYGNSPGSQRILSASEALFVHCRTDRNPEDEHFQNSRVPTGHRVLWQLRLSSAVPRRIVTSLPVFPFPHLPRWSTETAAILCRLPFRQRAARQLSTLWTSGLTERRERRPLFFPFCLSLFLNSPGVLLSLAKVCVALIPLRIGRVPQINDSR